MPQQRLAEFGDSSQLDPAAHALTPYMRHSIDLSAEQECDNLLDGCATTPLVVRVHVEPKVGTALWWLG